MTAKLNPVDKLLAEYGLFPAGKRERAAYEEAIMTVLFRMAGGRIGKPPTAPTRDWRHVPPDDVDQYLVAETHVVAQGILRQEAAAIRAPSVRDAEVFAFIEARRPYPRGGAEAWWASQYAAWNGVHPADQFRTSRSFRNAYRRGARGAAEAHEDTDYVAALAARDADRREARDQLVEVTAAAGLTPTTRATFKAIMAGEEVTPSRRQDLVTRLREAAAKKV